MQKLRRELALGLGRSAQAAARARRRYGTHGHGAGLGSALRTAGWTCPWRLEAHGTHRNACESGASAAGCHDRSCLPGTRVAAEPARPPHHLGRARAPRAAVARACLGTPVATTDLATGRCVD